MDVSSKNNKDLKQIDTDFKLSKELLKNENRTKIYRFIMVFLIVVIAILSTGVVFIWNQVRYNQIQSKLHYQMLYNINKSAFPEKRKKVATLWLANVALHYYPSWDENEISRLVDFIYEIGEVKYGVPVEFWGTHICQESRWDPEATSEAGAGGLYQTMPLTAAYLAEIEGIVYKGKITRYDPKYSIQMGMRYMKDYFEIYPKNLKIALLGYNYGERDVAIWNRKGKIPESRLKYYYDFIKMKCEIEQILGEGYNIPGLDIKDYAKVKKDFIDTKITKLEDMKAEAEAKTKLKKIEQNIDKK